MTKLVTVHPANGERGLATVQSDVLVMDAKTGERVALLDGTVVTARRTAGLSLLAVKTLAVDPQGPLLLVGAGVQARAHLEAFRQVLGTESVVIASRSAFKAQALAAYAQDLGMNAKVTSAPDEAARDAALIVTATTSALPVLQRALRAGQFVCAVGAFTPAMAELAPALVASSRVVVDTFVGTRAEAGELLQAAKLGVWHWEQASELGAHLAQPDRDLARATVFKSVGHALFDLAACTLLVRQSRERGGSGRG